MSLARLVITAVTVEGRSKSEVARDYGVSRVLGADSWCTAIEREGPAAFEPRSRRPHSNPRAVGLEVEDQIVRLRKTLTKKGLDAGAETIAAHLARPPGVVAGAGGLDDLADLVPPRVRHPAAAETAPLVLADVLRRPAQRTLAGRHHPLAAGRRHARWRSSTSSMTTPGSACASMARRITTGAQVWPASAPPSLAGACPAEVLTDNGAVFTGKQRGRGPGRVGGRSSGCAGSGSTTPGPTIRRPAARWNGSTRPRRSG